MSETMRDATFRQIIEHVQELRIVAGRKMDRYTAVDMNSVRSHRATARYETLLDLENTYREWKFYGHPAAETSES